MGIKERREREKQKLRRKILDTARAMFVKEGFEAVTMRKLAKQIEYSPTAIYMHFKDKEDLLQELCRVDFGELDEALKTLSESHPPLERLRVLGRAYVQFALDHPAQYQLLFMMPKPAMSEDNGASARSILPEQDAYEALKATFAELIANGALAPEAKDPDLLAQVYFCGLHGIVATCIAMGDCKRDYWRQPEDQADAFVTTLLNGLTK